MTEGKKGKQRRRTKKDKNEAKEEKKEEEKAEEKEEEKKEEEKKEEENIEEIKTEFNDTNKEEVKQSVEVDGGNIENNETDDDPKKPSKIPKVEKKDDISAAASKAKKTPKRGKKENKKGEGKKKKKTGGKKGGGNSEDKARVLTYLKEQNRPYSALNVFDNLHGEIKKAELQKILDTLTEEKEIQCKDFNKFIIYLTNQDKMPTVPQEELDQIDKEIDECREKLKDLTDKYKENQKGEF